MTQSAASRKVYASTCCDTSPIFNRSMVLDTSGDSLGMPTPVGRLLPSSDSRSETPWRALYKSVPSAKLMVMDERPGMDSDRMVANPAEPLTAFSTCFVTSSSTCCDEKPGASVWISTWDGTNSGNTSRGDLAAPQQPSTRARIVSVVAAPK
jgi:hypothetical protein